MPPLDLECAYQLSARYVPEPEIATGVDRSDRLPVRGKSGSRASHSLVPRSFPGAAGGRVEEVEAVATDGASGERVPVRRKRQRGEGALAIAPALRISRSRVPQTPGIIGPRRSEDLAVVTEGQSTNSFGAPGPGPLFLSLRPIPQTDDRVPAGGGEQARGG